MCSSEDAEKKITRARSMRGSDEERAKKELLEAAEIYLTLSMNADGRERANLARAEELFDEARDKTAPGSKTGSKRPEIREKQPARLASGSAQRKLSEPDHQASAAFTPVVNPSVTFKDIGGLQELKEEIRFKIIEPLLHPEVYAHYGKEAGGGILLYGPPGCGKSLIAEATAGEAGATFFHVKPSQIKSKYVGEAEKNIAELFRLAREHQPSIVFFDEFETLGADRDRTVANERGAITQLLTETDGMGTKGQQILLLAATNAPWAIDVALRREGRLGVSLFVPPPDRDAQKEVFRIHLRKKPLSADIDGQKLLDLTTGFSGADIKAVCERAADIPLREYFSTKKMRPLMMADLLAAIEQHRSILPQWFAKAQSELARQGKSEYFPEILETIQQKRSEHEQGSSMLAA